MKPSSGIEVGAYAWNRWIDAYKKQPQGQGQDHLVPLRLRGYSEIVMGDLSAKERKAIDSTLRRGYSLSRSPRWMVLMRLILRTVDWSIGYLGKTQGTLWFPNTEDRDKCLNHMEAQLVMTERFSADALREYGDDKILVKVDTGYNYTANEQKQLKAHFTELRLVADEYMAMWAAPREQLANSLLSDDAVVRVPFDTKEIET